MLFRSGRLEETLQRTSTLLAQLTNHAAVVLGPKADVAVVRSVQVVGVTAHLTTLVIVLSNGAVESASLEVASELSSDQYARVNELVARSMVGSPLGDAKFVPSSGDASVDQLVAAGLCREPGLVYAVGRLAVFAPKGSPLTVDPNLDGLARLLQIGRAHV